MTRSQRSLSALALLGLLTPLGISCIAPLPAEAGAGHNHGGGSEEELNEGEFRSMPVITLEGHGGYENNLTSEGKLCPLRHRRHVWGRHGMGPRQQREICARSSLRASPVW